MKIHLISSYPLKGYGVTNYVKGLLSGLSDVDTSYSTVSFSHNRFSYLLDIVKALNSVRKIQPDIVHIQYTHTGLGPLTPLLLLILRLFNVTTVMTFHEKDSIYYASIPRLFMKLYKSYNDLLYSTPNGIIVHTHEHARELLSLGRRTVSIINVGTESALEHTGGITDDEISLFRKKYSIPKGKYLLLLGHLRRSKKIENVIEGFLQSSINFDEYSLVIAGGVQKGSSYLEELKAIASKTVKTNNVIFTDFLPEHDMYLAVFAAFAMVLSYTKNTDSGILGKAIGYNVPIIASDVGGIGETLNDFKIGLAVAKNSPAYWSAAFNEFISHPERLDDYSKNLKNLYKQRNWPTIGTKHIETYQNILKD